MYLSETYFLDYTYDMEHAVFVCVPELCHLTMSSSSTCVVARDRILFFYWLNNIPLCMNVFYFYPFIHWWTTVEEDLVSFTTVSPVLENGPPHRHLMIFEQKWIYLQTFFSWYLYLKIGIDNRKERVETMQEQSRVWVCDSFVHSSHLLLSCCHWQSG